MTVTTSLNKHRRRRSRSARLGLLGVLALAYPGAALGAPTEPLTLEHYVRPDQECAACHNFPNPPPLAGEPSVAPQAYAGSLMSNSARDPVFWAGVAIASQDAPGETEDCIRCHAPVAFLEGRGDAIAIDALEPADLDGVSCELCHRMYDDLETEAGNARYVIDDQAEVNTVPRRGPWTYPENQDPQHPTSDDSEFIASARACGTCHDVTTARARVDDRGDPISAGFNEQRTYSEWRGSAYADEGGAYARTCQDCHMPAVEDVAGCLLFSVGGMTHATGGRRHELVGLNLGAMAMVQARYGAQAGGPINDALFEEARGFADALRQQAATLELEAPALVDLEEGIDALTITVTNETGHKLPSGYAEGRVMWLELTARYDGELVYSSGRWDEDARELEDDAQVRRYEALAEELSSGEQLHLLRNDHWIVDSRIPPRGLTPDLETDPVGDRYALQADDTWPHFDVASYSFPPVALAEVPGAPAELQLRARLLYLINTPEYLEFLVEDNVTNAAGDELLQLAEAHAPPEPIVLAELAWSAPLTGFAANETGTSGETGDTSAGTTADAGSSSASSSSSDGTSSESGNADATTEGDGSRPDDAEGCGCQSATGGGGWALLLLALARRRRPARRRRAATAGS